MLVSDFHRVRGRLLLMTVLFCMAFFVIVYRLYMWTIPSFLQKNVMNQADAGKDYSSTDDHNNAKKPVVFPVRRKDITDRHGISLATTIKTYALYIDPKKSINPQKILNKLHLLFPDLDYAQLEKKINGKSHVAIKRPITPYEAQKSHDLGFPSLYHRVRYDRVYPVGSIASHILGGVTIDGIGIAGVEAFLDKEIRDIKGKDSLALTIDISIQYALHEELQRALVKYSTIGAVAILLNVHSGEILGMVSLPDFDPNHRPIYATNVPLEQRATMNRSVQGRYEFGSVFKTFTWAQAYDQGFAQIDEIFTLPQKLSVEEISIGEFYHPGRYVTFQQGLEKSSNILSAQLADRIGGQRQPKFLENLGFMERVDVELVEAAGTMVPKKWRKSTVATVSFGHGIAITPLHLLTAYGSVVNGGVRISPTLILRDSNTTKKRSRYQTTQSQKKNLREKNKPDLQRIIASSTSSVVRELLSGVVERGTARKVKIPGYKLGGKTGTADKPNPELGGYYSDRVIASFVAIFPVDDPEYAMLVMLDEPSIDINGTVTRTASATAVPVARSILMRIMPLLNIIPNNQP